MAFAELLFSDISSQSCFVRQEHPILLYHAAKIFGIKKDLDPFALQWFNTPPRDPPRWTLVANSPLPQHLLGRRLRFKPAVVDLQVGSLI